MGGLSGSSEQPSSRHLAARQYNVGPDGETSGFQAFSLPLDSNAALARNMQ